MKKRIWIGLAAALLAAGLIVVLLLRNGQPHIIGICYRDNISDANTAYRTALEQELTDWGIQVFVTDADGDQSKQLDLIAQLAGKKCDVLIVEPVMTDASEELKDALISADLPVVLCNRELEPSVLENLPKAVYIGMDMEQAGTLQGQMVLQLPDGGDINGDGIISYLMIAGPANHSRGVMQTQKAEEALSSGTLDTQRLAIGYGDWTADSGRRICKQELAAFGKDIEVILCGNDQMAMGAIQAIADGGRTVGKDVYLFGMDGDPQALELITQGGMTGTVSQNDTAQIQKIADTAEQMLESIPAEKDIILPYVAVTADNTN